MGDRGDSLSPSRASLETVLTRIAFVHANQRTPGGMRPIIRSAARKCPAKRLLMSEARGPGLGGRALAEEPRAQERRGVKGAGGQRGLCGRAEGVWTGAHRASCPGSLLAAESLDQPPPVLWESLLVGLSEARCAAASIWTCPLAGGEGWHREIPLSSDWRKTRRLPAIRPARPTQPDARVGQHSSVRGPQPQDNPIPWALGC